MGSIVLFILVFPVIVDRLTAALGQIERNQAACGAGQAEEEQDQGPDGDPGGRFSCRVRLYT